MIPLVNSTRNLSLAPALCAKASPSEVPKKPPTPWTAYFSKEFPKYKKSDPAASTPDLMRRIRCGIYIYHTIMIKYNLSSQ